MDKSMRIAKIPKGKHKSSSSRFKLHWNTNIVTSKFLFDKSCKYDLKDVDQEDINKLFGISYGFHHKNSARFGWNWDMKQKKIEIFAYAYVDGIRQKKSICFIPTGKSVNFTITTYDHYYEFLVKHDEMPGGKSVFINKGDVPKWGYKLYPYFGGNEAAPHDVFLYHSEI